MIRVRHHIGGDDPVVRDHRIGGTPVLPAAAQIDAMLTVCDTTRPDSQWRLDQVAFVAPLDVPASKSGAQAGVEIEVAMDAGEGGECSVSSSRPDRGYGTDGGDGGERAWSVHSRARATGVALPPPRYIDVSQLRAGCSDAVPLSAVTEWRRGSGIEYGPAFRAIRALHRGPARMLALLRASEGGPPGSYFVPPALLDSVFQCLGMLDDGAAGACLPWYVGRITARRRISGTVLALVERTDAPASAESAGGGGFVRGRATVCNQQGEVLLELDRITLKSVSPPTSRAPVRTSARRSSGRVESPAWRPTVPTPVPMSSEGTTLVVSADDSARLTDRQLVRLTPQELRSERIDALPADIREVMYVAPRGITDAEKATEALHGVFTLVRRLAAHPPMPDLTVITGAAQNVTGGESVEPYQSALWGLARTLRTEYPRARVRLLDLGGSGTSAPPAPDTARFMEPELAWRDGSWYEPHLTPVPVDASSVEQPSAVRIGGGRFLITGGMGGIGLHVAEFLAREGCAHLTLVGRTEPQDGEIRQRLDRLAAVCDLDVVRADVRTLGDALRDTKPFDGVFHAAGVLRDGLARSLTPELIDEVFGPKIGGAHSLDTAFPPEARPGFVALFSSVSAVHGNLGQSGYSTANAYLDGYAAAKRAQGEAWYSLGWGLWTVGMGEGIVQAAAARGIPALSADEGIALLRAALALPPAHYVLSASPISKDEQMTLVTPEVGLWPSLSAILKKTLHIADVSPEDSLLDMGLDSMMAVEVAAALSAEGLEVDPVAFFEHGTVGALLGHLEALPRTGPAPSHTPPPTPAHAPAPTSTPTRSPMPSPPAVPQLSAPRVSLTAVAETVPAPMPAPALAPAHARAPEQQPTPVTPFIPEWDRFRNVDTSPSPAPGRRPWHTASAGPSPSAPGASIPRRTLPGRLSDLPHGSFLDRRIDALSAEDRVVVAQDDYFYEPVIEQAEGSWIKFDGRWFLNLASYSYLGLVGHDYIDQQAQRALERHGTGAHGVRLLAGTLHLHRELELTIARFLGTEDAIVFSSGYMANVATVGALAGPDDVIIGDVYNHASILDGYRLSGAKVITYAHNDLADLERALRTAGGAGRLVVTDAVFSMDGDIADLPGIVELCERYDAPLMVDEAHSLGVLGATGRGITEHFGIDPARVPIKMGTLSKTVPSAGGYVAGSSDLVFALKNNARGWMFSAAATPTQTAAAKAAIEVMEAAPTLAGELRATTDRYRDKLRRLGFNTLASESPVVPILCGSAEQAQTMARLCQRDGLFVQPIVYPAVPRALPRLRTIVNLSHSDDDLDEALATLEKAGRRIGLIA
ncbi:bifunctional SDR family oxidoreductase/pyridoxal phosphate-dependent aminotransferase family protein [Streptomyces sp. NPDC059479]|uniref:bifunctional SDR family oxidoreductase/pyridoxal phosphate-dependent aminotransferase family protein n=1 Tax=Streptomyces sp. NPDC059479 TaxID=3346848 RepID=UPI003688F08D